MQTHGTQAAWNEQSNSHAARARPQENPEFLATLQGKFFHTAQNVRHATMPLVVPPTDDTMSQEGLMMLRQKKKRIWSKNAQGPH